MAKYYDFGRMALWLDWIDVSYDWENVIKTRGSGKNKNKDGVMSILDGSMLCTNVSLVRYRESICIHVIVCRNGIHASNGMAVAVYGMIGCIDMIRICE